IKQPQRDMVAGERLDQRELGLVELPGRSEIAAVLVAVGIAEHDLLDVAAGGDQPAIVRLREDRRHDLAAALEIADRLEERDDIDAQAAVAWMQQPHLL